MRSPDNTVLLKSPDDGRNSNLVHDRMQTNSTVFNLQVSSDPSLLSIANAVTRHFRFDTWFAAKFLHSKLFELSDSTANALNVSRVTDLCVCVALFAKSQDLTRISFRILKHFHCVNQVWRQSTNFNSVFRYYYFIDSHQSVIHVKWEKALEISSTEVYW